MLANPLIRLLAWNWLAGAAAAVTLMVGILATNAMHLRDLILGSDNPVVPIVMLLFGFLVTFCSVAMGSAIMGLGQSDDPTGGRGQRDTAEGGDGWVPQLPSPVPVKVRSGLPAGRADASGL